MGLGAYMKTSTVRAILTDSHFWLPVIVLGFGITLLVYLA
jgi:hypothetical protein